MQTSIYARIGGAPSVTAAVDRFYEKVLADPAVAEYFDGLDMGRLKAHQRAFFGAALGGPQSYTGRGMYPAHAGLGVTDAAFNRVVAHLAITLRELGVAEEMSDEIMRTLAPLRADIVEPVPTRAAAARGVRRLLRRAHLRTPA